MKISEWDVGYYTNGACWSLAWQIYRATPQPHVICTLGDSKGWDQDWYHVVVKVGEDKYLDVEGLHSARQLKKRWRIHPFNVYIIEHPEFKNATQYKRRIGGPPWRDLVDTHYAHTVLVAKLLVEENVHD